MSFELIMLLGFFGAGLLGLLPEKSEQPAEDDFRSHHPGHGNAANRVQALARHPGRAPDVNRGRNVNRLRGGSRAAA